jgi:hypothetical protein
MKKKWWEHFNYISGTSFCVWLLTDKSSILSFILLGIGIVSTVIYFFNQLKNE